LIDVTVATPLLDRRHSRSRRPSDRRHRRPTALIDATVAPTSTNQGQRKNIPSAEKHKGPESTRKAQSNEV
jgi:hypothetical protein